MDKPTSISLDAPNAPARREYELSTAELDEILAAGSPVPAMLYALGTPPSLADKVEQLEEEVIIKNVNAAWEKIGAKHGFVWQSAQPSTTRQGDQFITAFPLTPAPEVHLFDNQ